MAKRLSILLVVLAVASVLVHRGLRPPEVRNQYAFGRGPDIVLVNGLGSPIQFWLPTARHLARDHHVTLVELPGHGGAPMPVPFSLARAADDLDRAIRESANGPVILVGHSLGGLVAALTALEHPERIRGLVLVETALKPQIVPGERDRLIASLELEYERLVHDAYLDFGRDSLQGERIYAEAMLTDPGTMKQWIRLSWTADLSGQMRKLQPLLLAVLAPRSWAPDEKWQKVAKELGYDGVPRVRPLRLEGCGHFPMLDRPEALADVIARFAAHPDGEPVAGR